MDKLTSADIYVIEHDLLDSFGSAFEYNFSAENVAIEMAMELAFKEGVRAMSEKIIKQLEG